MSRSSYYEDLKALAREKRALHQVHTNAFGLRELRKIYSQEGVRIDQWPFTYKVKALYMCEGGVSSVAVRRRLPDEPKLFALVHELKHHYADREGLGNGAFPCCDYNQNEMIEIGAEVFAAEFIFPQAEFEQALVALGVEHWEPSDVVHLKHSICAKVSYQFLCKRLEWLELVPPGHFRTVQFKKLDASIYGAPFRRFALAKLGSLAERRLHQGGSD